MVVMYYIDTHVQWALGQLLTFRAASMLRERDDHSWGKCQLRRPSPSEKAGLI